jgi:N-acetylneuraminate synthase
MAELGSVHDGSLGTALRLISEVKAAGADAAKLQCHFGERIKGEPPWFSATHESRVEYLERTGFSEAQWHVIREHCTDERIDLVVSPFSVAAVEMLERVGVDGYKVASGQVTNLGMLKAIGRTEKPVYLSSGMTTDRELEDAVDALNSVTATLHCTSSYPCPPELVGLNVLRQWITVWKSSDFRRPPFGLSDHTLGMAASLAAVTLGATVIERHVCFDRRGYGSDCRHSLTLDEFAAFLREVRALETMLANPVDKDALAKTADMQRMRECFLERSE